MADRYAPAVRALVGHFRRQRPLRAGSLIITLFGDSIAPRGGAITLGSLIRLARPFGISERLVRTSVARLAREDWLTTRRAGRLSEYRLSHGGRRRFADATRRIYAEMPRAWNGLWTLVLLPGPGAAAREELGWLGFGEPSAGVFAHPTRSAADAREQLARLNGASRGLVLEARNDDPDADRRLAREGWDLAELAKRYRRLVRTFEPVRAALVRDLAREPAFIVRTLLVHEYRKIHLRDPLLPESLLPPDWIGTRAYELCRSLYALTFEPAEEHLSRMATRLGGALPEPDVEVFRRFGGLGAFSRAEDGRRRPSRTSPASARARRETDSRGSRPSRDGRS